MSVTFPETVPPGELVYWSAVSQGRQVHAFTRDPDSTFLTMVPLCRAGLSQNSYAAMAGLPRCPVCERTFKFLNETANRYLKRGQDEGRAEARLATVSPADASK